jgi:hypothetical protein
LVSASQRELKGDWRRAAVSKRISELDDAACVEADREALSDDAAEDGEE